ncbi:MAG: flavodoxin family protein [Verrucomicrobiota bacterium]
MANILVLFYSKTGNTAKMADLVREGIHEIPGHEVRLHPLADATADDIKWCDGLALGSPTHMGSIPWEMKKFWDEDLADIWGDIDGKIGCAFASMGGWGGGAEIACLQLQVVMQNFGFLTFGVTDYSGKQFTLHYGAVQAGEPREDREKESPRRLGRRLAEWCSVFVDGKSENHPCASGKKRFPWK